MESLTNVSWTLIAVEQVGEVVEEVEAGDFVIQFKEDGTISGNELCNGCGGTYELTGESGLQISAACTEIGCPRYSFYTLSRFPYGSTNYTIQNNELRIQIEETEITQVYTTLKTTP